MDRKEFKSLSDKERIEFFESEYEKNILHNEILKSYDLAKNTVADTFKRNGYAYDKSLGKYILNEYYESVTKVIPKQEATQKYYNDSTLEKEMMNIISWVKEQKEKQAENEELLNWVKRQRDNENIIELSKLEISETAITGEVVGKTFKAHDVVLNRFNEFCDKSTYRKQDILSQALYDFLNKYYI